MKKENISIPFDPKVTIYPYPEETDKHYLPLGKQKEITFDESYPYIDKTKKFKKETKFVRFMLRTIGFSISNTKMGLKIKGKANIKKHENELKNGVISVSNHVHLMDYMSIMRSVWPYKTYILVWDKNVKGKDGWLVRHVGGIPIPEDDIKATFKYLDDVKEMLNDGGWLHVYPEGSMWEYYQPIRPFKKGASFLAVDTDKPILPMAYSYRKANWFRRFFFHQKAVFNLNIGEPIYANKELDRFEAVNDLTIRSHDAVCSLAGINPKDNIYSPIFNNSKRVDYYTKEYGIKKKKKQNRKDK